MRVVATPDPPPSGVPNPVHSAEGAAAAGYAGALVAGIRIYGWAAEVVVERLGAAWLESGWADVTLRRPLFAGEEVTVTVGAPGDAVGEGCAVEVRTADRVVLDGRVGSGTAVWASSIAPPAFAPAEDPPAVRPGYDLVSAPIGVPLRPLGVTVDERAARRLATADLGLEGSAVPVDRLHPWFLAGRMAPLTRHNFTYGPTIHVRSQIQHVGPARLGEIVVGAVIREVYDRNGHAYQVLDGSVTDGDGAGVARIRHHTIFRPRGT